MKRKYIIAFAVCLAALSLDQISKTKIRSLYYDTMEEQLYSFLPGVFEFRYAENTGMAFGMLQYLNPGLRLPLFSLITLIAVTIIIHLLRQAPGRAVLLPSSLGFILSGAFGNLTDRYRWGVVVDFIRVQITKNYSWPTFNLADTFITVGIALLILDTILQSEKVGEKQIPSSLPASSPEAPPSEEPPFTS